jgi:hypothetical protein
MIQRLMFGCDDMLKSALLQSGNWNGTPADLDALLEHVAFRLPHILPR